MGFCIRIFRCIMLQEDVPIRCLKNSILHFRYRNTCSRIIPDPSIQGQPLVLCAIASAVSVIKLAKYSLKCYVFILSPPRSSELDGDRCLSGLLLHLHSLNGVYHLPQGGITLQSDLSGEVYYPHNQPKITCLFNFISFLPHSFLYQTVS